MSGVEFELRLVLRPEPARPASAWLLPGDDPGAWLDGLGALAEAQGAGASTFELWIVPGAGLLASARRPQSPGSAVAAQPYGLVGERLLVPVEGALFPEVTGAEVDELLAPGLHLLHPAAGLVRLAPEARLQVADLLARPPEAAGAWRALEPPTAPLRLTSIEVLDPPPLEEFLRQGAGGVAEAPPSEAPPAPDEQAQGGAGAWIEQQAARFVQWAAGAEPKEKEQEKREQKQEEQQPAGEGGGLLDRLRRWSEKTLDNVKDARERELDRLLHLLDHDPDEGLRYALPLAGGASGGPPAPPGAKLPPRSVDYGAGGPRRGASADPWEIDAERHRRLVERYRELASRELRLGRYRRAAYVFAELLGDLAAAASALEQGRHFREAAALYKDRLGRPLDAARCLERGGLLVEAAQLYEAERRWVEAGDVWTRLERADDARRAYRRAVEARVAQDDALSAARLLETKLDATDEALELLASTWPAHAQAGLCLEERLGLLARGTRHEAARVVIEQLRQDPRREGRELVLARALGGVAARYPEASVQAGARDLARVVSGERLARRPGPEEAEALLQVISRLDPTDRLLGRDVGRMSAQLRREAAKALLTRPALRGEGWTARVVREQWLSRGVFVTSWRDVQLRADVIWAVGVQEDAGLVSVQRVPWSVPRSARTTWEHPGEGVIFAPPPLRAAGGAIVVAGARPLRTQQLPADGDLPACEVGTPGWLPVGDRVLALARSGPGLVWTLSDDAGRGRVLRSFDANGRLTGTCAVATTSSGTTPPDEESPPLPETPPILRVTANGRAVLVHGLELLRFYGTEPVSRWHLDQPGHDLALLEGRFAAAVSHDEGGRVFFDDERHGPLRFGEGLHAPRIAFTPDGLLVAATKDEGRVYLVHGSTVAHQGTFAGPGADVLCVRATGRPRSVVVVTTDGTVRELELTRS